MHNAILLTIGVLLSGFNPSPGQEAPVYRPGDGVTLPVLVRDTKPAYTPEAMRERISGTIKLECVVEVDGTVSDIRVVQPLDPGLDESAVLALRQWRFRPGTKDGKPVRVRVEVEMTFTMADNTPRLDSLDVFKPGPGVTAPRILKEVKPEYPPAVRGAGTQGTVTLECVVQPDGRVGDTRVTRSLNPDLDREAIRALRQWRFLPGERQGKPVPVQISVEISFALK